MEKRHHRLWHTVQEYITHWSVAGVFLTATGTAPEHWFAELLHKVPLPHEALPVWLAHVDYRLVAVIAGLSIVVGDNLWRHHGNRALVTSQSELQIVPPAAPSELLAGPSLPDKPSIAVLAFDNLSGDREQEYFSDGVADDIITELSHDRSLFVIARNSSFTYKGHAVDVKQAARELGVRYILDGSVRRDSGHMRVNVQLIDAETGSHLWADRYDRAVEDIFALQDEIAAAVTRAIHPALADAEQRRALRKPPENLGAWEAYQRARWHMGRHDVAENEKARAFLQRAIETDPMLSAAYVSLTVTFILDAVVFGTTRSDAAYYQRLDALARKAVSINPDDADAQAALAWKIAATGAHDEGWNRVSKALATSPNS
jgi:adenylate cyclase